MYLTFVNTTWTKYAKILKSGDYFNVSPGPIAFYSLWEFANSLHNLMIRIWAWASRGLLLWQGASIIWELPGAGVTKLESWEPLSHSKFSPQISAQYISCEGQEARELHKKTWKAESFSLFGYLATKESRIWTEISESPCHRDRETRGGLSATETATHTCYSSVLGYI